MLGLEHALQHVEGAADGVQCVLPGVAAPALEGGTGATATTARGGDEAQNEDPKQADFGSERGAVVGVGEQLHLLGGERWGVQVGSGRVGDGGWTWIGAGGVPTGAVGCRRRRGRDVGVGGGQRGVLHGARTVLLWSGTRRQMGGTQTINTRRRGRAPGAAGTC